jgi:hypothetical protein
MAKVKVISVDVLESKTVVELRELCKKYGISGMSKARKDDIVDAIQQFYDDVEDSYDGQEEPKNDSKVPYINANLHSFLKSDNNYQTLISVSCGAASSNYPVVGKSAGYVKATYREILNIETDAKAIVNGNEVNDSHILKSGDTLEFVRKAGVKG